jgi:hypothetical protein
MGADILRCALREHNMPAELWLLSVYLPLTLQHLQNSQDQQIESNFNQAHADSPTLFLSGQRMMPFRIADNR